MLFNSIEFACFLLIVFAIYWFILRNRLKAQNFFLFIASSFFYGSWDWRFLGLLYLSASIDFATAYYIDKTENVARRKLLLALTLVSNLTILGFFKYFNFFAESFTLLLSQFNIHASEIALRIILPVGISFYTFQSIAYVVDVYRRQIKPCTDIINFMAFVSFFPQLVAGPIERAKHMLPQFQRVRIFDYSFAVSGLRLILYGLFKKVVIADNVSKFVDEVYNQPDAYFGIVTIAATLLFALQIYCDFSGYSDIAVGTGRLFGFDLMKNFRTPYFSASLKEFWQRWHISLSTWFRDYLYIPLGGNKVSEARKYLNLLITFVVSGLWHGANFTFIIWGAIHGCYIVIEDSLKEWTGFKLPRPIGVLLTFAVVCYAWVFFRAKNLTDALIISSGFFKGCSWQTFADAWIKVYYSPVFIGLLFCSIALFILCEIIITRNEPVVVFKKTPQLIRVAFYYLLIVLIAFIGLNDSAPSFIYFRF